MLEKIPVETRRPKPRAPFWRAFGIAAAVALVVFGIYLVMSASLPDDTVRQAPVAVPQQLDSPEAEGQAEQGSPAGQ